MSKNILLESHLKTLKLPAFLREYSNQSDRCAKENKEYAEYLLELSDIEVAERVERATRRIITRAGFPAEKEVSDFKFEYVPKLNKRIITELAGSEYIDKRENIVFLGAPGVGKTHLAIALGREACRRGKRVKFFTASGLATAYAEARDEKRIQRLEGHIDRSHLIIVDELGYVPLGKGSAEDLFNFFSLCYERTSLIVTTNLPFSEWPQVFGDERLAGALIDRLTHRVHIIDIEGESYRLKKSLAENKVKSGKGGIKKFESSKNADLANGENV